MISDGDKGEGQISDTRGRRMSIVLDSDMESLEAAGGLSRGFWFRADCKPLDGIYANAAR